MEQQLSFSDFKFVPPIARAVVQAGYDNPTPIQVKAIPHVLSGKDVLGLAQTGTGKTAAFALPILHRLSEGPRKIPRALVIVPTRELAEQVLQVFKQFSAGTGLRSVAVYGGVGFQNQLDAFRRGVEIIVACPGRLLDHIDKRAVNLRTIETLVLDEADQMFDMGFLPTIRRILKVLPPKRQNLLFSATMPSELRSLAFEVLRDPVTVEVDAGRAATTVKHALYDVPQDQKSGLLRKLLGTMDSESVLVFTRTKHRAKRIANDLQKHGHSATSLQGNLSQNQRVRAMEGFRSGKFRILVATDIAARGLDISSVSHVVNFDIPDTVEAYVHRIGRTGRAARTGDALTLVTPEDEPMVRAIERHLRLRIERKGSDGNRRREEPQHYKRFSKSGNKFGRKGLNTQAKRAIPELHSAFRSGRE